MSPRCLLDFDPDRIDRAVVALRVDALEHATELPTHTHAKGQLVLALRGSVTSEVPGGYWMVPPHCAMWVPAGVPHSNRISANAQIGYLFIAPDAMAMPRHCCTLSISPLVRELILHLGTLPQDYPAASPTSRLAAVLLECLAGMPTEQLYLPISDDPRLRRIAEALMRAPDEQASVAHWARQVAMSERTLARHVLSHTGMTFGRWRQQLKLIVALQRLSAGVPVQTVAGDLGYESVSAFISMFKRVLGKPPARYLAERGNARPPSAQGTGQWTAP